MWDARVKEKIMKKLHAKSIGGHSGMQATGSKEHFTGREICSFVRECDVCQRNKNEHVPGIITTFTDSRQGMGLYNYGFHRRIADI